MSDSNGQSRTVSFEQVKTIIDFMTQHVEFASGNLRSLEARHTSKRLWEELAKMLNSCQGGTRKSSDGWSKYWSDFKNKLKNKVWLLKRKRSGSSLKGIRPLTMMEKRALAILGPYYEKRKTRQGYTESNSNNLHPEVKLESLQETTQAGSSDRLSETSNCSNESSGGEYVNNSSVDNADNDTNEPVMHNIYPQWLIEIETKRADAELIRAKAEEHRAVVAAKNAETATLQANALRRLADAAQTQAEAMIRMARVMEDHRQRQMMAM